jgi:hypothetical protein
MCKSFVTSIGKYEMLDNPIYKSKHGVCLSVCLWWQTGQGGVGQGQGGVGRPVKSF